MLKRNYKSDIYPNAHELSHTATLVFPSVLVFQIYYLLILNTLFAHATSQLRSTRRGRLGAVAPPLTSPHMCSPSPPQKQESAATCCPWGISL